MLMENTFIFIYFSQQGLLLNYSCIIVVIPAQRRFWLPSNGRRDGTSESDTRLVTDTRRTASASMFCTVKFNATDWWCNNASAVTIAPTMTTWQPTHTSTRLSFNGRFFFCFKVVIILSVPSDIVSFLSREAQWDVNHEEAEDRYPSIPTCGHRKWVTAKLQLMIVFIHHFSLNRSFRRGESCQRVTQLKVAHGGYFNNSRVIKVFLRDTKNLVVLLRGNKTTEVRFSTRRRDGGLRDDRTA